MINKLQIKGLHSHNHQHLTGRKSDLYMQSLLPAFWLIDFYSIFVKIC